MPAALSGALSRRSRRGAARCSHARAGASGSAISLVSADEAKQLQDIERLIKRKIEREEVEGFEPAHVVPESIKNKPSNKPGQGKKTAKKSSHRKGHSWNSNEKGARGRNGSASNKSKNPANRNRRPATGAANAV